MTLRVELASPGSPDWDPFVASAAGATHCHLLGWRDVIARVHGHQTPYLVARDAAGAVQGVLPLVRVASPLFGRFLVSMPFLNYGGPLGSDPAVRALAAEAVRLGREARAGLVELRSRRALPLDLPVSHRKITVVLDLVPGDPEKVFAAFKGKLRSQVRRPQKEGVTVRFGPGEVEPFYRVFARHMRDLGTPAQPRALFEVMAAVFGERAWFGCAYLNDEPIAGGCGLVFNGEFEMIWASALTAHNAISPNMAVYWAFMERAAAERLTAFNFGRCTPGTGTHRFKQQWGSRDEPLFWYQHAEGVAATPSPDDAAYAWGPRLWKHLPVPVANALGPRIVRYIP